MAEQSFISALLHGAVTYVSQLLQQAIHPFTIVNKIRSAYRGMNMQEVSKTYWMGVQAYSAGQEVAGPTGSGLANLADIPINPEGLGPNAKGQQFRFQFVGSFYLPGEVEPRYRTINEYTNQNLSYADIQKLWEDWLTFVMNQQSPLPGNPQGLGVIPGPIVSVTNIERAF